MKALARTTTAVDTARLGIMLGELRLPTIKTVWPRFAEQADKEGWPAARFLAALAEHELAERDRRRIERHLAEARLPPGKTLDGFDFAAVPMLLEGSGHGGRRRRRLACAGGQPAPVRPTRRREEPSRCSDRARSRRGRLQGAVHPHHRPRPKSCRLPGATSAWRRPSAGSTASTC